MAYLRPRAPHRPMVRVVEVPPAPALRPFVRNYLLRVADLEDEEAVYPLAACPELFLEFYLRDRYSVRDPASGDEAEAPAAVVVGPSTRRSVDLVLRGRPRVFTVHFEPAGLFQLFGVSPAEVVDAAVEAPLALGRAVRDLHEALAEAPSFGDVVRRAEGFLLDRLPGCRGAHPVQGAARLLRERSVPVTGLAASYGLGLRQFERSFKEQVGLAPKRYARVARFDAARRLRARRPDLSWAAVAHELGYADQMHLVRDFRAFAGAPPSGLAAGDEGSDVRVRAGGASDVAFVLGRGADVP